MSFFGCDNRSDKKRLLDEYCEDVPMIGGNWLVDEMREFINGISEDRDLSNMSIEELKILKNEQMP